MPHSRLCKTADFQHTFSTFDPAQPGTCRIRIFQSEKSEHASAQANAPVIIISQDPASAGSITNFVEQIATDVLRHLRSGCDRTRHPRAGSNSPVQEAVWVQHFPLGTMLHPTEERFSTVTFQSQPDGTLCDPCWQTAPRAFVEHTLLNAPLAD